MKNDKIIICNKKYILFDLDGTLTDPFLGITQSVQYALKHFGIHTDDLKELSKFIGPPLMDSFQEYYNFSEDQSREAVEKYRERFADTGIYENEIYSGIKGLLKDLKEDGRHLYIATSKPEIYAKRISDYFDITKYFSQITGSMLDGTRVDKSEVIKHIFDTAEIGSKEDSIMVGDRMHDIVGAQKNGIDSIGVSYGYGGPHELEKAGATYVVDTVEKLRDILMNSYLGE